MTQPNPPEVPFDMVLDDIIDKAADWHGYYTEAMETLPKDVQQFVDDTSWAGELHEAERKKLIKQNLIATLQALVTASKPEKQPLQATPSDPWTGTVKPEISIAKQQGYNYAADLYETNLLKALKGGSES